jgi:hypothetical protein
MPARIAAKKTLFRAKMTEKKLYLQEILSIRECNVQCWFYL